MDIEAGVLFYRRWYS